MSLTDIIYQELMNGLKTGLNYGQICRKYEKSKGPFYNALQRVFTDAGKEIDDLSSLLRQRQLSLAEHDTKLKTKVKELKEADVAVQAHRQEKQGLGRDIGTLKTQVEALRKALDTKVKLRDQLRELQEMGFDEKKLESLRDKLKAIGVKRGFKPTDAINKFFNDLKDYDNMIGFQQELQRLETIAETKRLEADRWRAEKESLEIQYKELKSTIAATNSLIKQGVKVEQIVSWNRVLQQVGGVQNLEKAISEYKSIKEVLAVETREVERLRSTKAELSAETKTLEEHKVEIEGAIKSISELGAKQLAEMKDKALSEFKALIDELRNEIERLAKAKAEAGKLERELYYARYLTGDDQALKTAPNELIKCFVDTTMKWCKLKEIYLRVDVPDLLKPKYTFLSYEQIYLTDLLAWAVAGLDQYDKHEKWRLSKQG
jgi:chromosome segregation ATPase